MDSVGRRVASVLVRLLNFDWEFCFFIATSFSNIASVYKVFPAELSFSIINILSHYYSDVFLWALPIVVYQEWLKSIPESFLELIYISESPKRTSIWVCLQVILLKRVLSITVRNCLALDYVAQFVDQCQELFFGVNLR